MRERMEKSFYHPAGVIIWDLLMIYGGKLLNLFLYRLLERSKVIGAEWTSDITSVIFTAAVCGIYFKLIHKKGILINSRKKDFDQKRGWREVLAGIFIILAAVCAVLIRETESVITIQRIIQISLHPQPDKIFLYVWKAGITAVWEEILARGIVVWLLFSYWGEKRVWSVAFVSSFIFALGHSLFNPASIVSAFCFGMLAFAVTYALGRLWSAVGLHFLANFIFWIAKEGLTDPYMNETIRRVAEYDFVKLYLRNHFVSYAQSWYFLQLLMLLTAVLIIFTCHLRRKKMDSGQGEQAAPNHGRMGAEERKSPYSGWDKAEFGKVYFLSLSVGFRQMRVWGCFIMAALLGVVSAEMVSLNTAGFTKAWQAALFGWPGELSFYVYALIAILPALIIGEEFAQRTVNNMLYTGIRRKEFLWGKFLYLTTVVALSTLLSAGAFLIGVESGSKIHGNPFLLADGISAGEYAVYLLLIFSVFMGVSAFAFCLCTLCGSQIKAVLAGMTLMYSGYLLEKILEFSQIPDLVVFTGYLPLHMVRNLVDAAAGGRLWHCEYLGFFWVMLLGDIAMLMIGQERFEKRNFM